MKELMDLAKKYWIGIVLCILALIVLNTVFGTVCFSKLFIGLPCPACGITRAAILLLTGHFKESFQMHPLLLLVIIEAVFCLIIKKTLNNCRFFINISVIIVVVIFVSFYIYRMKLYYPNAEPLTYWQDNFLFKFIELFHKYKTA